MFTHRTKYCAMISTSNKTTTTKGEPTMKEGNFYITKSQAALIIYLDSMQNGEPESTAVKNAKDCIKDIEDNAWLIGEALDRMIDRVGLQEAFRYSEIFNIND